MDPDKIQELIERLEQNEKDGKVLSLVSIQEYLKAILIHLSGKVEIEN